MFTQYNITHSIKILQINIGRRKTAYDLIFHTAQEHNIDVSIVSETNKNKAKNGLADADFDTQIIIHNNTITIKKHGQGKGFNWIETGELLIFSCYVSPNVPIETLETMLDSMENITRHTEMMVIIGGDFNGKSIGWGEKTTDRRGHLIEEWLAKNDFYTANIGNTPTFQRNNSESIIDITIADIKHSNWVTNWRVMEEESLSDHAYITFTLVIPDAGRRHRVHNTSTTLSGKRTIVGWNINNLQPETFIRSFQETMEREGHVDHENIHKLIEMVCNKELKKKVTADGKRKPVYWWNGEIAEARRKNLKIKRLVRHNKKNDLSVEEKEELRTEYKKTKIELGKLISKSKRDKWRNLLDDLNNDIWGQAYQIATKKLQLNTQIKLDTEKQKEIARKLFPVDKKTVWTNEEETEEGTIPELTTEEFINTVGNLKNKKAPGIDGIPAEILKLLIQHMPEFFRVIHWNVIQIRKFPSKWKTAKLCLIPKNKLDANGEMTYRPICLINTLGKILEGIVEKRLRTEIDEKDGLSDNQFGFRRGRSTIDAISKVKEIAESAKIGAYQHKKVCLMITFDIKNAFNTAKWEIIVKELRRKNISKYLIDIIKSYLTERTLIIDNKEIDLTMGVPQGSLLGPLLWNIYYDEILRTPTGKGVHLIAYADDLAAVIVGKNEKELKEKAETICG